MIFVLVKNGIVEHCVAVDAADDLVDYYPEHQIIERTGDENIGWSYDGASFSPPEGA